MPDIREAAMAASLLVYEAFLAVVFLTELFFAAVLRALGVGFCSINSASNADSFSALAH